MKIFTTIALAAAAVSSSAYAETAQQSFTRDGYTYVYSVAQKGSAHQIQGKYYPGGRTFALNLHKGRVTGTINNMAVDFRAPAAKPADTLASAN